MSKHNITESITESAHDATQAYADALAQECENDARTLDAKRATTLIKRYSGGVLSVRLSAEDYTASVAPFFNIGAAGSPVARAARSKDGAAVSVGVAPVALFAAVAKTRGEGEDIDHARAFRAVLSRLDGNAGALAAFNAKTARAAEKTPAPVFEALKAFRVAA